MVYGVKEGSIAEEIALVKGDYIVSINGQEIFDILDYKFMEADSYVELEIEHQDGEIEIYEIEKDEEDELGIIFETELIDKPRNCHNNCIFCFMEQLPENVRKTLIFKDDDYRLSFFSGNYITLTNMKEFDINRVIKYRLSPINISIHATDEKTRCMMLNNRFAGKVLQYLDRFAKAGISMNTQIVLCKGINDGKILEKTIIDLSKHVPALKSICIVPVGLSKNREGLYPLLPIEKQDCIDLINLVSPYQEEFKEKYNTPLVFLADEFYLKAGSEMPSYDDYGEFGQLEDGIGMTALFEHEFNKELNKLKKNIKQGDKISQNKKRTITLVTGKITKEYITKKTDSISSLLPNIKVNIISPVNLYFGDQITVTGLVTGRDILKTIKEKIKEGIDLGEYLMLPRVMLKDDEDIFLDDTKLVDLQKELGIKIVVTDGTAKCFLESIISYEGEETIYKYAEKSQGISYEDSACK